MASAPARTAKAASRLGRVAPPCLAQSGIRRVGPVRVVIALGGNAMTAPDGTAGPEDQRVAIEGAIQHVAAIVAAGHQVVLTHGNGPQVGNILVKNDTRRVRRPTVPLDWCGAQTQGKHRRARS